MDDLKKQRAGKPQNLSVFQCLAYLLIPHSGLKSYLLERNFHIRCEVVPDSPYPGDISQGSHAEIVVSSGF